MKMAYKRDKINVAILKDVSEILQFEVKDPDINFVTITRVDVTRDYSYAKIYVSFIDKDNVEKQMKALDNAKGFIRTELAARLKMYKVPALIFVYDDSYEKSQKIEKILADIHKNEK